MFTFITLKLLGAEVVPIPLRLPEDELRKMFDSVNGILFPGGAQVKAG